jgi:type VI secretion system secreted protein VgrG
MAEKSLKDYSQKDRWLSVGFPADPELFLLDSFEGKEEISRPFHFTLGLLSLNPNIDPIEILKSEMTVRMILADGEVREINGVVRSFSLLQQEGALVRYQAEIVPELWFLSLTQNSRFFQDYSALDIIEEVLGNGEVLSDNRATERTTDPREYCVQYRESDFAFVSRLMEEEGIYYYFEHGAGSHTMVLASDFSDCPSWYTEPIPYRPSSQGRDVRDFEAVTEAARKNWVHSGAAILVGYDMEDPKLNLECQERGDHFDDYEVYDFPGMYTETKVGEDFARVRLEALSARRKTLTGSGDCRAFSPGSEFQMVGHESGDLNDPWVLLSVAHSASGGGYESWAPEAHYENHFECIPTGTVFRPPRTTPKPIIPGSQVARVVGTGDHEIETDEFGRVKVAFYWDRDRVESCWIRVSQPWAGPSAGGMMIPHIGDEVIVSFLEGDPDQPIITGRVYNGETETPYTLPDDKTKSYIRSWALNEIMMDDRDGEELLYFRAEKDRKMEVLDNNEETVETDETITIGKMQTLDVGEDRTVTVEGNHEETVGSDQTLSITGNRDMTVASDLTDTIDGSRTTSVGGDESTSVNGGMTLDVSKDSTISIMGKGDVSVTGDASLSGIGKVEISSVNEIKLSAGLASITLKNTGDIEIKGLNVKVDGSLTTEVKAGTKLTLKGLTSGIN